MIVNMSHWVYICTQSVCEFFSVRMKMFRNNFADIIPRHCRSNTNQAPDIVGGASRTWSSKSLDLGIRKLKHLGEKLGVRITEGMEKRELLDELDNAIQYNKQQLVTLTREHLPEVFQEVGIQAVPDINDSEVFDALVKANFEPLTAALGLTFPYEGSFSL